MVDPAAPETVTVLAGFIAPFIVAFLQRARWVAWQKQLAVLGVAVVLAVMAMVGQEVAAGDTAWTLEGVLVRVTAVAAVAQSTYAVLLKKGEALYELPGATELLKRLAHGAAMPQRLGILTPRVGVFGARFHRAGQERFGPLPVAAVHGANALLGQLPG